MEEGERTNRSIHNKDNLVWVHRVGDFKHLFEQRVFLLVTSRRVYNDNVKLLLLELFHACTHNATGGGRRGRREAGGTRRVESAT